jgi:hypothetical protein
MFVANSRCPYLIFFFRFIGHLRLIGKHLHWSTSTIERKLRQK